MLRVNIVPTGLTFITITLTQMYRAVTGIGSLAAGYRQLRLEQKLMKNYARMSSRGFQSTTNIRLHYVLGSRLRRIEGRLVEEVNQMLIDGLGLDGKKKGKHPPSDRTARGWARRF